MPLIEIVSFLRTLHVRVIAWLSLGISAGLVVLSLGLAQRVYPGFERADLHARDMMQVQQQIASVTQQMTAQIGGVTSYQNRHQAIDDSKSILQLKAQECGLPKDAPKDVYSATIIDLAQEYQHLTGQVYSIPSCGDL